MNSKSPLPVNLSAELAVIYQRLEEELAQLNPGCDQCGTCCNFGAYGHVLYASGAEINFIRDSVEIPDVKASDDVCPFLKNNQCSIRGFRVLGCRIFFCNPQYQEVSHTIYEKYLRMIKELHQTHNIPWDYQPFLNQIADLKPTPGPAQ